MVCSSAFRGCPRNGFPRLLCVLGSSRVTKTTIEPFWKFQAQAQPTAVQLQVFPHRSARKGKIIWPYVPVVVIRKMPRLCPFKCGRIGERHECVCQEQEPSGRGHHTQVSAHSNPPEQKSDLVLLSQVVGPDKHSMLLLLLLMTLMKQPHDVKISSYRHDLNHEKP